jgi:alkanesulfonate monooxygenase SsuD/methylene tetrahydromethanopterin reductase-like flavin-dependent oxidoreductase (luciferase family)
MRVGLILPDYTWTETPSALGPGLGQIARLADEAGFASIAVLDHLFQIGPIGPPDDPMLEAYTTLAFLAGQTSRVQLGTLVTPVHFRQPGILAKIVTTLDVLSGGRAWLGIGAGGFNEEESRGLGVPYPPLARRFEQLEEALQIVL